MIWILLTLVLFNFNSQKVRLNFNINFIQDYGFQYIIERNDISQYYELLNIIFKAYLHIICAYYEIDFLGYRYHDHRKNKIPTECLKFENDFDYPYKNSDYII